MAQPSLPGLPNSPEVQQLHAACISGNVDSIRRALAAGVSPDAEVLIRECYWPLLTLVCWKGDRPELISMLLSAGANPDGPYGPPRNALPLHLAINLGRIRSIELLIAAGASLNLRSKADRTPVEYMTHSNARSSPFMRSNCRRILPMLLRAGSPLPRLEFPIQPGKAFRKEWLELAGYPIPPPEYNVRSRQILCGLVEKVAAAGSWAAYERAHRTRLTAIFVNKLPRLPADAISHIVGLWAHTGYY